MLISHSHHFIFIHIQKTAGQSLKRVLAPFCSQPPRTGLRRLLSHLPVPEDSRDIAFRAHTTARWARFKLSPAVFDRYTRFAVVRNPFDRAVSNYHFVRQRPEHHTHRYAKCMDFVEYLAFLKSRRWARDPTQRGRLVDTHGRLLVDPLLRFESLEADFATLCARLGIDACELPRRNTSRHEPWREYYRDPAARALVLDLFAADFAEFGYSRTVDA